MFEGKTAIVTGGARGIGAALAAALADAGAAVVIADLDADAAERAARDLDADAIGVGCDVSDERALAELFDLARERHGSIDLYFANAGVAPGQGLGSEDEWTAGLDVNLLAHVRAARLLVPYWLERGGGCFVATASAAGLLTQLGSATYAVSKHAALGFAEWLSVTYGERGIQVCCLCPMGVRTQMLSDSTDLALRSVTTAGDVLEPAAVAEETLAAIAAGRFLVAPHPEALEHFRRKAEDHDRWIHGMQRMQRKLGGPAEP